MLNDPINFTDPVGLATQVIIWGGAGWGESSLGHASVVINGTAYSYGPGGMTIQDAAAYALRQNFRYGIGIDLDLTRGQEGMFENYLRNHHDDYSVFTGNVCTTPIREGLSQFGGFNFTPRSVLPPALGLELYSSGHVAGGADYSPTVAPIGSRAPWAPTLAPGRP